MRRSAGWLPLVVVLAACRTAGHDPGPASVGAGGTPTVVLLETSEIRCDGGRDSNLRTATMAQQKALIDALAPQGITVQPPPRPGGRALRAAIHEWGASPLVFIYVGHGQVEPSPDAGAPARSVLCLDTGAADHPAIDELLAEIPDRVPYAIFVIDACASADVDVRKSRVPVAVLSASPESIKSTGRGTTQLGALLPAALSHDDNCDGIITDVELLDYILANRGPNRAGLVIPKLRRQSWSDLPVVVPKQAARCERPRRRSLDAVRAADPSGGIASREEAIRSGAIAALAREASVHFVSAAGMTSDIDPLGAALARQIADVRDLSRSLLGTQLVQLSPLGAAVHLYRARDGEDIGELAPASVPAALARAQAGQLACARPNGVIWHGGWVSGDITTIDGEQIPEKALVPVYCERPFGQCFEVNMGAVSPGGGK